MRTKTRLSLWLGMLAFLVLVLGGVSLGTIWNMGSEGKDVLKANYNSIAYAQRMLEAIDLEEDTTERARTLVSELASQKANITEPGEAELTERLSQAIVAFRSSPGDIANTREMRKHLNGVIDMNRAAIVRKAADAEDRADKAFVWISIAGTLCFLITFTLFLSLPERIAEPIRVLTEGIDRIAAGHYNERVELEGGGEFGHMADRFNAMASELERWENSNLARIMEEKARAEAVINSLRDASIGVDDQGAILFANRQALELLGLAEHDLVGRSAPEVAARNDLFRHVLSDKAATPFKAVLDGKEQYFIADTSPIQGRSRALGMVHTVRNITPFQERDQAKTHFLATVSHELKTPLASTDIGLGLLERSTWTTDDQRAILADLRKDHQRLVRIVSELLDLAQAESGNIKLHLSETRISGIVTNAMEAVKASALQKLIHFEVLTGKEERMVRADADKAVWVLVNLLSNAIKHSPAEGIITITSSQQESWEVLTVGDQGPGIPVDEQDNIFQRFAKGSSANQGTGLGLSIAREFMQAMGGSITYDRTAGSGATFSLHFRSVQ